MSEKTRKQDRRTRYTRQTIKDTFLELLNQKSFTKITVTEICKNAEINRGTFYLHYYDIYDVLSDIFNDMTQDMLTTVDHLFCLNQKSCSYPFCQKIQMESQYRALFLDDAIAPILLEKLAENHGVCRTSKYFLLGGSPALCQNGGEIGCDFAPIPYKHSSFPDIPFGMPDFKLFCFQPLKSMLSLMKKDDSPFFRSESCNEAY